MSSPKELVIRGRKVVQAGADRDETDDLREVATHSLYVFNKVICGFHEFVQHLHLPLCKWLQSNRPRKRVLLMPRSTFKTSMARGLGMWVTVQDPYSNPYFPGRAGCNMRILYAAENEKRAISRITWIRRQYMHNKLFRALWPNLVWPPGEKDADIWTISRFALPRTEDYPEATFEAAGVDSGSTGGHYDILIPDDLIGARTLKQPELMNTAIEWWKTMHSLFDKEEVDYAFVFGTRWRTEDLYSWIFENEPDYDRRIYAASKRPLDLPSSGNDDTALLFPERLSRATLKELERKYGQLYWLNYENEPFLGGNAAFNMMLCGQCVIDTEGTIAFDRDRIEHRILEIVEHEDAKVNHELGKVKSFFKLTPDERAERWNEMMKRWRQDRINRIETN